MNAVKWKKIRLSKVSDYFDSARQLYFLVLNESIKIDYWRCHQKEIDKDEVTSNLGGFDSGLPFFLAKKYRTILNNHDEWSNYN